MNPLEWKREHQAALGLGAIIGLLVGPIVGFSVSGNGANWDYWIWQFDRTAPWAVFGALIGAAIIYAAEMARR